MSRKFERALTEAMNAFVTTMTGVVTRPAKETKAKAKATNGANGKNGKHGKHSKKPRAIKAKASPAPAGGESFACGKCKKTFARKNWKTMHERFCEGEAQAS